MSPQETNEFFVQFTAPASPWWLLVLAPLAGLLGWWLYRRDMPALSRAPRVGLTTLRCALLVALTFLAFRPNVVNRSTLTYAGRVIFVIDDSLSMLARDDRMSDGEALRLARAQTPDEDHDAPLQTAANRLTQAVGGLREFERFSRSAQRSTDAYWEQSGKAQADLDQQWVRTIDTASVSKALIEKVAADAGGEFEGTLAQAAELRASASTLFAGDRWPGHKSFEDYYRNVDALSIRLLNLQSMIDRQQIGRGDQQLKSEADSVRNRFRLDLSKAQVSRLLPALPRMLPTQQFECVSLMSGNRQALTPASLNAIEARGGSTNLVGCLQAIADEASEFPVTAVVLLSDGRDVAHRAASPVEAELSRQQIPVYAVGVGEPNEPTDLAIADVIAPPIAVMGRTINVVAMVKSSLSASAKTDIELSCDGKAISTTRVDLAPAARIAVPLTITPERPGLFRYSATIHSPQGVTEAFPTENNSAEFVINIRKEPLRVLLLDWKPRWETRFALNVLQRMPYVQLNSIISVTQKETAMPRGAQLGSWPDNESTLALYDVVILGSLPDSMLSNDEWSQLTAWTQKRGGTLAFLAPRGTQGELNIPPSASALLPIADLAMSTTQPAPLQRLDQIQLAAPGLRHPLTLELADSLAQAVAPINPASLNTSLRPAAQPLLMGPTSDSPLITWQPFGRGKTLLVDSDRLWLALNPSAHRAHLQMFVELVTWAIEGGPDPAADPAMPNLVLDRRRGIAQRGLQVWAQNAADDEVVEAIVDDKTVAEAPLKAARIGASLRRADFAHLPPRGVTLRLKSNPAVVTPMVMLTAHDAELNELGRNDAWLSELSHATGGEYQTLSHLDHALQSIDPKLRVERREKVWRLWDSPLVMSIIVIILSIEWVWRKFVGLV